VQCLGSPTHATGALWPVLRKTQLLKYSYASFVIQLRRHLHPLRQALTINRATAIFLRFRRATLSLRQYTCRSNRVGSEAFALITSSYTRTRVFWVIFPFYLVPWYVPLVDVVVGFRVMIDFITLCYLISTISQRCSKVSEGWAMPRRVRSSVDIIIWSALRGAYFDNDYTTFLLSSKLRLSRPSRLSSRARLVPNCLRNPAIRERFPTDIFGSGSRDCTIAKILFTWPALTQGLLFFFVSLHLDHRGHMLNLENTSQK